MYLKSFLIFTLIIVENYCFITPTTLLCNVNDHKEIDKLIIDFIQKFNKQTLPCKFHIKSSIELLMTKINLSLKTNFENYIANIEEMKTTLYELRDNNFRKPVEMCQLELKSYADNLDQFKKEITGNLTESPFLNIVTEIKEQKKFELANDKELIQQKSLSLTELIPAIYQNNVKNGYLVMEYLDSLRDSEKKFFGYRVLFDEMKKNDHEYSGVSMVIGSKVFKELTNSSVANEQILYIRENLPKSIREFPWFKPISILNSKVSEYLNYYSDRHNYHFQLFTTQYSKCSDSHCIWNITLNEDNNNFIIYTEEIGQISVHQYYEDGGRRYLGFYSYGSSSFWEFQPVKNTEYFKIKNVQHGEYLMVEETFMENDKYLVFIKASRSEVDCNENCKWKILNV